MFQPFNSRLSLSLSLFLSLSLSLTHTHTHIQPTTTNAVFFGSIIDESCGERSKSLVPAAELARQWNLQASHAQCSCESHSPTLVSLKPWYFLHVLFRFFLKKKKKIYIYIYNSESFATSISYTPHSILEMRKLQLRKGVTHPGPHSESVRNDWMRSQVLP